MPRRGRALSRVLAAGVLALALGYGICVYRGYVHINGAAADRYPVRGIDVSRYQGEIDWMKVPRQGIEFAYVKATEGSSHVDQQFAGNVAGARDAGVAVGAYHFFSFDSPGASQAEHFLGTAGVFQGLMVPAVDVEFYGNKRENPPDADSVEVQLRDFLDRVELECGKKPVIYATGEAWEIYIRGRFDEYPLWIRNIWREPDLRDGDGPAAGQGDKEDEKNGQKGWTFWQYTDRGRLEGFSGEERFVDLNVFFGTGKQWEMWLGNEKE